MLGRTVSPVLACAASLWLARSLRDGTADELEWSLAVVFFPLVSAAASCPDLLEAVGDQPDARD